MGSILEDPYELLEVSHRASEEVIRAAYRRLARKYHPDSGEFPNPARMVAINHAFELLIDEDRKRDFDAAWMSSGEVDPPRETNVETLLRQADAAAKAEDWDTVSILSDRILQLSPRNLDALTFRLDAFSMSRDPRLAEAVQDVLAVAPNNAFALLCAGDLAAGQGDWIRSRGFAATLLVLRLENDAARELWDEAQEQLNP